MSLPECESGRLTGDEEEHVAPRSRSTFVMQVQIRAASVAQCEMVCVDGIDIETVYNWLKFFKMEEYAQNFEKDGFDTLRGVATIDEDDLIDMGVKKGHRRVVLSHIEELRNQLSMLDESAEDAGMEPLSSPTISMLPPIAKQLSTSSIVSASGASAGGTDTIHTRTERRGSVTTSVDV